MTIWEIQAEYFAQSQRNSEDWKAWNTLHQQDRAKYPKFEGFHVDYDGLAERLVAAIMEEGFTKEQAGYIYGEAYERGHSSFGDVFSIAANLAEWVRKFPGIKV